MTSKMFLTSVAAVMLAMPAMAEPWPSNDIMLENKIYTDAATEEHMLVSADGATANATADYEAILYQIAAGKYLPAGAESVIDCDQNGYFCPGSQTDVKYNASSAQGLTQCPDGYASSAAGASAANQCYKACTTDMVAHATGVKGNDYYDDGADTCEPTSCAAGWHLKSFDLAEEYSKASQINSESGTFAYMNSNDSGSYFYHEDTWYNGTSKEQSYYGISRKNEWATTLDDFAMGVVRGTGRCSTIQGENSTGRWSYDWNNTTTLSTLIDETGQAGARYCYCNVTGYKVPGEITFQTMSSAWVFLRVFEYGYNCAYSCAHDCAMFTVAQGQEYRQYRSALFRTVKGVATCAANTINIQWDGIDEPTTVTYGGDITTPTAAKKIPGQRFKGWKFTTPGQTTGE